MADEVARLVAVLEANLKGFTKGMEQAQKTADRRFGQIERRLTQTERRFAGAFKTLGSALLGGASVVGITRFVKHVSDVAGALQDTSEALGVSTDALQTWGILAGRAGVSQEQFNKALGQFSQRLGEAQLKGGTFAKFLSGIGVGTSGSTEEVFFRLADAIKNTADQSQRAAIVAEAFGARAVKLTPILQQGSAALRAQGVEFAKNGSIMTREAIAKIDDLGDKWEDLKRQMTAIGGNVLAGFADSFSQFADDLRSPAFQEALTNFGRVMGEVAALLVKIAPILPNLISGFAGLSIGGRFGPAGAAIGGVIGLAFPEVLGQATKSVEELEAELAALKSTLAGGLTVVSPDEIANLEKLIAAARRARAEAAGIPFKPQPSAAPAATGGGVDRSGTLETSEGGRPVAERERAIYLDTIDALEDLINKRHEADDDFRRRQGEEAQDLRNRSGFNALGMNAQTLEELADFHERANAAWAGYWERQAEMAQEAHDVLKEDIADSILFLGEAALEGGEQFTRALKSMIVQASLLAVKMNILKPLLDWVLGGAPGGGLLGGLLEGRASGGRVMPGQPYVVGERRPELFVPDTAGTIIPKLPNIPSPQSRAVGGMVVHLNQTMSLAANGDAQLAQIARQGAAEGAAIAIRTIQRNFPAMMIKAQRDRL